MILAENNLESPYLSVFNWGKNHLPRIELQKFKPGNIMSALSHC